MPMLPAYHLPLVKLTHDHTPLMVEALVEEVSSLPHVDVRQLVLLLDGPYCYVPQSIHHHQ
jgi:hypothetical protein